MKPHSRKAKSITVILQNINTGPVIASIEGSVKKNGNQYRNALLVLFNAKNFMPIAAKSPDTDGKYSFAGLNTELKTFIVAFDNKKQFNAVIQDNVVPK